MDTNNLNPNTQDTPNQSPLEQPSTEVFPTSQHTASQDNVPVNTSTQINSTVPEKKKRVWPWVVLAVVALIILGFIILAIIATIGYNQHLKTILEDTSYQDQYWDQDQPPSNITIASTSTPNEIFDDLITQLAKKHTLTNQGRSTYYGSSRPIWRNASGEELGIYVPSDSYWLTTPANQECQEGNSYVEELIDEVGEMTDRLADNAGFSINQRNTDSASGAFAYENDDYLMIVSGSGCVTSSDSETSSYSLRLTSVLKAELGCSENLDPKLKSLSPQIDSLVAEVNAWTTITTEENHQHFFDVFSSGTAIVAGCIRGSRNCFHDWTQNPAEAYTMFALLNLDDDYSYESGVPRTVLEEFITQYFNKTIDSRINTEEMYDPVNDIFRYETGGGNGVTYTLDQVKISPNGDQVALIANSSFYNDDVGGLAETGLDNACILDGVFYIILDVLDDGRYVFNSEFTQDLSIQLEI